VIGRMMKRKAMEHTHVLIILRVHSSLWC
jgi:hypothetical protein